MKIFVVGFPKAGTSSIQFALEQAKIKSVHWAKYSLPRSLSHMGHITRNGSPAAAVGVLIQWAKKDNLPLLFYLNEYKAFTQMDISLNKDLCYFPQLTDIPQLDAQYPGSKFIFNTRPIDRWINSVNRWGDLRKRLTRLEIPGLPKGKGKEDQHLADWHDQHLENTINYFKNQSNKLLVFNIEKDDPKKLANFLGLKNIVWEHKNKNRKK